MSRLPRNYAVPLVIIALLIAGWQSGGPQGLLIAVGGLLMWALLHFTRLMNVMQKAAKNPIGHVGSAVMLNARLKAGVNLMHVVAMTRSLGRQLSPQGHEPEIYAWVDAGGSEVTCEFESGRLARWRLVRPQGESES
ncbi:glycerate kinase [Melaminivora suipulveris]|uniref:Glycerate kinase n=1 Tax=Melaminivora suipulveris TaxID=2109913 RepID=A0A2R3QBP2_9BURK|nr:glycerate kinase [Melaminivora suipulveris]AVO49208.1 glycerate kinase [Melaminivora suipulveris]